MRPWTPLLVGAALGGATCALLTFVPRPQGIALLSLILVAAGWVYVGSALSDGRLRFVVLEVGLAVVFLALAFVGLWYSPWALVVGFVGHGVWDWFHEHPENDRQAGAPVRALWYPPACVGYDWLVALFIVDWYLLGGAF